MQLLMYTDYALRALVYVGTHPAHPVSASAIAHAYQISPDHVAKATKALTRAQLLHATRGARGGVQLAKPASEIQIGTVVRLFEGNRGAVDCAGTTGLPCRIAASCELRGVFAEAQEAFYAILDRYSLADVIQNRSQLVQLLRVGRRS
jgi:Rrf2 family nitric oxide-sensitive transcriptional repressor